MITIPQFYKLPNCFKSPGMLYIIYVHIRHVRQLCLCIITSSCLFFSWIKRYSTNQELKAMLKMVASENDETFPSCCDEWQNGLKDLWHAIPYYFLFLFSSIIFIFFRHWNYFLSFAATDGKNGNGLKLEKVGLAFSSFNAMPAETTQKILWLVISLLKFVWYLLAFLQEHFWILNSNILVTYPLKHESWHFFY